MTTSGLYPPLRVIAGAGSGKTNTLDHFSQVVAATVALSDGDIFTMEADGGQGRLMTVVRRSPARGRIPRYRTVTNVKMNSLAL